MNPVKLNNGHKWLKILNKTIIGIPTVEKIIKQIRTAKIIKKNRRR